MTKRRAIKIACGVVAAIVAVGALMPVTVATRSPKTCTFCRAERIARTFLGYTCPTYRATEFTDWYRTHILDHQHECARLTCTGASTILRTTTIFACGPRPPIC